MRKKVLSPEELEILMRLPTTVTEAQSIKKRFAAILKRLRSRSVGHLPYKIEIGCPHCVYGDCAFIYRCGECRYNNPPFTTGGVPVMACIRVKFGGVSANDVRDVVVLSATGATVYPDGMSRTAPSAIRWAQGHVEWATAVIKAGGTHLEVLPGCPAA